MNNKIAIVILIALFLSVLAVSNARADRYLGETTWNVTISNSSDNPPGTTFTLTGGISRINSSYYLFQGYVLPSPLEPPYILSGSGVLIGNNLILTLTVSQDHSSGWLDTGVLRATLNRTTLNGNFYEVRTDLSPAEPTRTFTDGYSIGTLSRSGKAIPLNPVLAPVNTLLLNQ